MKKLFLLLALLIHVTNLVPQEVKGPAPRRGYLSGINISQQTLIGAAAVLAVAAAILIYKSDNSH